MRGERGRLGRLAGSLGALERDEPATRGPSRVESRPECSRPSDASGPVIHPGRRAANTPQAPGRERRTARRRRRDPTADRPARLDPDAHAIRRVQPATDQWRSSRPDDNVSTRRVRPRPPGRSPDWSPSIGAGSLLVSAADHLDAPTTKANHRIDITDLYAFKSAGGTTLVLNVNPLTSPADSKTARFDSERASTSSTSTATSTAYADIAYRVKFGNTRTLSNGNVVQNYTIKRVDRRLGPDQRLDRDHRSPTARRRPTSGTSLRVAHISGGGKAFAGVRDDPFFFDLPGFVEFKKQLLAGSTDLGVLLGGFTGVDTFKGTNVSSIAIEVPNARLGGTGKTVGVWATVLAAIRRGLPAGRADGPPGDQHGVQQHQRGEGSGQPPRARAMTARSTGTTSSPTMTAIDHVLEATRASNYTRGRDPGIANVLTAGHPDDQARRLRRLPQRAPAQRRRDQRRVLAAHPRQRHERWRQRQRHDVPGHVPLPRRAALTGPRPGPATGRSGPRPLHPARPNAGTHTTR